MDHLRSVEYARDALERFDVSKYAQASSLNILDWRALISYRSGMLMNIDWMQDAERESRLCAYVRRIDVAPLALLGAGRKAYGPTVQSLSVAEVYSLHDEIRRHMPEHLASIERLLERESNARDYDLSNDADVEALMAHVEATKSLEDGLDVSYTDELRRVGIDSGGLDYVAIDAEAPDDVLIEDFKQWLKQRREVFGKAPAITENDLRKWSQHRVLPYLDLTILANLAGVTLTNYVIGCKLFADLNEIDLAEKVRKTTAPLAEWLIGEGHPQLQAKANAELRKQNGRNWGHETFRSD